MPITLPLTLPNGYTLVAIPPGHESPMEQHEGGDIAVDDDHRIMYVWEVFLVLYGAQSIVTACLQYRPHQPSLKKNSPDAP